MFRWPWSPRLLSRQALGALGERHAARFLRARGMRLLDANYRTRFGELDLVAREGAVLVFVEVRTRVEQSPVSPLSSVNPDKQARVIRLARAYCRARQVSECAIRFDVVEVIATGAGRVIAVRHHVGAFGDAP